MRNVSVTPEGTDQYLFLSTLDGRRLTEQEKLVLTRLMSVYLLCLPLKQENVRLTIGDGREDDSLC